MDADAFVEGSKQPHFDSLDSLIFSGLLELPSNT